MLKKVLDDYLSIIKEREFDLPFLSLLPSMGYYDVHFTHGGVEFGKDFIAKKIENGIEIQYSFQSKAGDISQALWRNEIQGQMLEAVISNLSHPNFNTKLPHQTVLVITGQLKGNASLGLQDLNSQIKNMRKKLPIIVWDKAAVMR